MSLGPGGVEPNEYCDAPSLSADGRRVAYVSSASNLVPGVTDGLHHIYVSDTTTGATRLADVGLGGAPADDDSEQPSLSPDGRYVAFASRGTNLVTSGTDGVKNVYLRDLKAGTTTLVSMATNSGQEHFDRGGPLTVSRGGRYVVFTALEMLTPDDHNNASSVFVRDTVAGTTSVASGNYHEYPTQSGGGGAVGSTVAISADGRYVAFPSDAEDLVPNCKNDGTSRSQLYVRDTQAGTFACASMGYGGVPADGSALFISMTPDGKTVSFSSYASNLTAKPDTDGRNDVYVNTRP